MHLPEDLTERAVGVAGPETPGRGRWVVLLTAVLAVSLLHYATPRAYSHWHLVYQRLYYLPILFGAFWYGARGGLATALLAAGCYLPHIVLHWGHEPLYRANQLADLVVFPVVGTVAGVLIDRIRQEREQHRRTAEELARAYSQLQQTFERLRLVDRLSALGALSASMAHEIKNPLGSILGAIEILQSQTPREDRRREFVEILEREVQRLSRIVSTQLDLVRPVRPERGPHDLGEIVQSVVALARKEAEQHGVALEAEVEPGLPALMVDGQQVRQSVLNLVINAMQALEAPHGSRRGGRIELRVARHGERVRVVVEDDGPGLDPTTRRRAFEPFYTTKDRGTGLGLSIAFQIADQHGGDLWFEEPPHGGTRFVLELPIEGSAAAPGGGLAAGGSGS